MHLRKFYLLHDMHFMQKDIGETGRRLGDHFCEHLRDVERNDKDASKPVARNFTFSPSFPKALVRIDHLPVFQCEKE